MRGWPVTSLMRRGGRLLSSPAMRRAWRPLLALLLCGVVLALGQSLSRSLDFFAVRHALFAMPPHLLLACLAATLASYAALVLREVLALREAGARISLGTLLVGSVGAVALGNAVGFGALTGAAVRYRVYGAEGGTAAQVARVTMLANLGFTLALLGFGGAGAMIAAPTLADVLGLPVAVPLAGGGALLALALVPILWCGAGRAPLRIWRFTIERPTRGAALVQMALNAADLLLAGAALYVLQPAPGIGFPSFFAIYSCAILLGVISHSPAGLGVFDAAMLLAARRARADGSGGRRAARLSRDLFPAAARCRRRAARGQRDAAASAPEPRSARRPATGLRPSSSASSPSRSAPCSSSPARRPRSAIASRCSSRCVPLWMLEGSHLPRQPGRRAACCSSRAASSCGSTAPGGWLSCSRC